MLDTTAEMRRKTWYHVRWKLAETADYSECRKIKAAGRYMCLLRVAYFETALSAEGSLNDEGGLMAEIANVSRRDRYLPFVFPSKNFRRTIISAFVQIIKCPKHKRDKNNYINDPLLHRIEINRFNVKIYSICRKKCLLSCGTLSIARWSFMPVITSSIYHRIRILAKSHRAGSKRTYGY